MSLALNSGFIPSSELKDHSWQGWEGGTEETYVVLGIQTTLVTCKASLLPIVLSLQPCKNIVDELFGDGGIERATSCSAQELLHHQLGGHVVPQIECGPPAHKACIRFFGTILRI